MFLFEYKMTGRVQKDSNPSVTCQGQVWHAKVNVLEFTSIYILKTYYIEVHDNSVIQTGLQIRICVQYHDIPDNIRLDYQAWCKPVTNFIIYMTKRTKSNIFYSDTQN